MKKKLTSRLVALSAVAAVSYISFEYYQNNMVERKLVRDYEKEYKTMETAPVVLNNKLLLISFDRPVTKSFGESVTVFDEETKEKLYDISWDKGLGSAIVDDGKVFVFGTSDWSKLQNCIYKAELDLGDSPRIINEEKIYCAGKNKRIFNTSVAKAKDGYVLAFEVDENRKSVFYTSFLQSTNLSNFKLVDTEFRKGTYTACPTIRYSNGYYHLFYLDRYVVKESNKKNDEATGAKDSNIAIETLKIDEPINKEVTYYRTMMSYSKDLKTLDKNNSIVFLDPKDGISPNNSDMDMMEFKGNTQIFFAESDQKSWATVYKANFNSSLDNLLSMLRNESLTKNNSKL